MVSFCLVEFPGLSSILFFLLGHISYSSPPVTYMMVPRVAIVISTYLTSRRFYLSPPTESEVFLMSYTSGLVMYPILNLPQTDMTLPMRSLLVPT